MTEPTVIDVEAAAEAYLKVFDHYGVDYYFSSPGSEDGPYWEYLAKYEDVEGEVPTPVICRHEAVAVNMAKGYTLMTGRPQVVKLHVQSGPQNAAMALHGLYHYLVPMVVLSGYSATHEHELFGGTPGAHYLHMQYPGGFENMFYRSMKWLVDLDTNENAERVLSRAIRVADSHPKGPVFVNIARELAHDTGMDRAEIPTYTTARPPAPSEATLDEMASKLSAAENPLIITSWLGRDPDRVPELVALAERLDAPVFEHPKYKNSFPMDHPLYVGGSSGRTDTPEAYFEKDVDLVFVIDCDQPWYPPEGGAPASAEVVMVNPEPVQEKRQYWNYPADLLVTAESSQVLGPLVERVERFEGSRPVDWRDEHDRWVERWREPVEAGRGAKPIDPFWLTHLVDAAIPDDAIVCEETTVHGSIISNVVTDGTDRKRFRAARENFAGLGTGLGLALGAKLAEPERMAVALVGDGAFNYNPVMASFGAAQEHDLPLLAVVYNNGAYRSMRSSLERYYPEGWADQRGTFYGSDIEPKPDYAAVIDAWAGHGETVEDPDEIEPALDRAVDAVEGGQSALVDVLLEEDPPTYPSYP